MRGSCGAGEEGVLQQALTGAGIEYLRLAQNLVATHEQYDSAVSHQFIGGFYFVAPWPIGDKRKAVTALERSVELAPDSRRNNYNLAVAVMKTGEPARAAQLCEAALRADCVSNEADYCDALTAEVKRLRSLAQEALA